MECLSLVRAFRVVVEGFFTVTSGGRPPFPSGDAVASWFRHRSSLRGVLILGVSGDSDKIVRRGGPPASTVTLTRPTARRTITFRSVSVRIIRDRICDNIMMVRFIPLHAIPSLTI